MVVWGGWPASMDDDNDKKKKPKRKNNKKIPTNEQQQQLQPQQSKPTLRELGSVYMTSSYNNVNNLNDKLIDMANIGYGENKKGIDL